MKHATTLPAAAILALFASSAVAVHAQTAADATAPAGTSAAAAVETPPTPTSAGQVPADVQPGSWAYNAVQDLASKGLIAGYPPDGKFLGNRALTRYEMATIIARVLARMNELAASGASGQGMQTQLDEVRRLTDDYKVELTVIGTRLDQAEADITKLQGDVSTLQSGLNSAYDAIEEQANRTSALSKRVDAVNNTAYSSNPKNKYNITGYIQARFVTANGGTYKRFPEGSAASSGAYNGNYAQNGSKSGAQVRRARIKIAGAPTNNTTYAAQIDLSGAITPQSTSSAAASSGSGSVNAVTTPANQQVTVREAWVGYTFGNGDATKYPTVTAGQFANPFGYVLPASTASILTPERPLAFSENSVGSPWLAQDYDKGAKINYAGLAGFNLTYALINGSGRNAENIYNHFDSVYRAAYTVPTHVVTASIGASYYDGFAYRTRPSNVASPIPYPEPKKQIAGVDAQVGYKNFFVDGEFMKGKFEQRSFFNESASGATGPNLLTQTAYVKGNIAQGYYVWGGYTFNPTGSRPLTLAADYDVFQRSISAQTAGGGNSSFDDVNIGYGVLYNLDKATRLRLWWDQPTRVSHAPFTTPPPSLGLGTAELQVKF